MEINRENEKIKNINFAILVAFLLILLLFSFHGGLVTGQENSEENKSDYEKASHCLKESLRIMDSLSKEGFNIQRVNDSLINAKNIYDVQSILKETDKKYDFSNVLSYCDEIENVYKFATKSRDEFEALKKFYDMSLDEEMNTSSVDSIMREIESEIKNERYEKIEPLVKKAYEEISTVKSEQTALKLFYKSTTRSIKEFLKDNWKSIAIILAAGIFFFLFYRTIIYKWRLQNKLSKLELRKSTIKDLIAKTQKDYFEKGIISEGMYNVKIKKYAELIRDIDRQIPLIRESLLRVDKNIKKKK